MIAHVYLHVRACVYIRVGTFSACVFACVIYMKFFIAGDSKTLGLGICCCDGLFIHNLL